MQNARYKSFLFSFFFVKNYFRNYGYAKNFCLNKEKYILIYLSDILLNNWYYFCFETEQKKPTN